VPLSETLSLSPGEVSVSELASLARSTAHTVNKLREGMLENVDGIATLRGSVPDALCRASLGYEILKKAIPCVQVAHACPKGFLTSRIMSYLGIEGFFFPFTAEANINIDIPTFLIPFSASHELAHLGGYAREEEANFIACLACRAHPDIDFRYAGRLSELIYILNALYETDNGTYNGLREDLHPGIWRDMAFLNHFWDEYEGVMEEVAEAVNDVYLKSNSQEEGILSYGMVVDLLLADYQTPVF
jgi:hypothetical protein